MFLSWAIARLVRSPAELRWSIPVVGAVMLELTVAWLFTKRAAAKEEGTWVDIGVACVSLVAGAGLLTMLPRQAEDWSWLSLGLIAVGSMLAIAALLNLGRSFAIFPARRTLIRHGLYRWIRHPAYAGELIIMLGVTVAAGSIPAWLLMAMTMAGIIVRVEREERLLSTDENHATYRQQTRWRLLPGIW